MTLKVTIYNSTLKTPFRVDFSHKTAQMANSGLYRAQSLGPVSGPESPQKTNSSEFRPNGTESPQNQSDLTEKSKFCDFGPVSGSESAQESENWPFWSCFGVRSGPKSGFWAECRLRIPKFNQFGRFGSRFGPKIAPKRPIGPRKSAFGPKATKRGGFQSHFGTEITQNHSKDQSGRFGCRSPWILI